MKKILFFARDPGGVSAIYPVFESLKEKYLCSVYSKDYAFDFFLKNKIKSTKIDTFEEIRDFYDYSLIVTGTSYLDFLEKQIWLEAEKEKIPSIAILDHWMGYDRFFDPKSARNFYPKHLCVIDEIAADSFKKVNSSFFSRLHITGNPYFDVVMEKKANRMSIEKLKKALLGSCKKVIFYGAEKIKGFPIEKKYGFNEFTQFEFLFNYLKEIEEKSKIIFRPHPKHNIDEVKEELKRFISDNVQIEVDQSQNPFLKIQAADLVFGINSMILVESWLLDCNVYSLQISSNNVSEFDLVKLNIIPRIKNPGEIKLAFCDSIKKNNYDKSVLINSTKKIVSIIERLSA